MNVKDEREFTALMWATFKNNSTCLKMLVNKGADVNICDQTGSSLMLAAAKGFANCVSILLKAGADVNTVDCNGRTALDLAEMNENEVCCRRLEEYIYQTS